MNLLKRAWEQREGRVYPTLFGGIGEGIYTLPFELFRDQFGCDSVDPTWLHYGVFKSPPNDQRSTWLYISSGLSNPWGTEEPQEHSGLGVEYILETKEDAYWAIALVQSLVAFSILIAVGRYGQKPMLWYGDRIPQPIDPNLSHLVLGLPAVCPPAFDLASGKVDLIQIVGIAKSEYEYAVEHGSEALCAALREAGSYPLTDPHRNAIRLNAT